MGNPCSLYDTWPQVCDPFPSQMRCPGHMDQAWEDLNWDTSLQAVTSSRVRTEVGRGSKEKLPPQQSSGSPGARGEERRACHRLVFSGGLGASCDFFTTLFNQTRPNCNSNTAQHQLTDLLLLNHYWVSPILSHATAYFYLSIALLCLYSGCFSGFFPRQFLLLARAAQNFNLAFQGACSLPSYFLSYVNLTVALSAPSVISIMKTVSITKARTEPWGISLTPVFQFNSRPWITTLTSAWWNAVHPHYRPAN